MNNLYKSIRLTAKLNQEQFAFELGTTTLTVNRWENEKAVPNKMAQNQLLRFCREHQIEIGELIVESKKYAEPCDQIVLYHGSKKGIQGEISPISRNECDFGSGFYMGSRTIQPLTLVCSEISPKFYAVSLDINNLKILNLSIDLDWAMLIAYYRKEMDSIMGSPIYNKYAHFIDGYDVVAGYIADDRMYTVLARFFRGEITDVALLNCLSALDLGKQYVAVSEKACKQIKVLKEYTLTQLELSVLEEMNTERRKEGIQLADEIVKKYRREGRFFDEIIGG